MGPSCSRIAATAITRAPATVPYKWGTCFGYINGVADALVPAGVYCLPAGVKAGQVLDVAKLYIQDHPDKRYLPAPQLIVNALAEKFPCN